MGRTKIYLNEEEKQNAIKKQKLQYYYYKLGDLGKMKNKLRYYKSMVKKYQENPVKLTKYNQKVKEIMEEINNFK